MIAYSENNNGLLIPSQNGLNLCDFYDPQVEAIKWVYSLGQISGDSLMVLGLGGGHHIDALLQVYPHMHITVLETREGLNQVFKAQYSDLLRQVEIRCVDAESDCSDLLESRKTLVTFKACWGEEMQKFASLFSELSGRSMEFVSYQIEEMNLDIKAHIRNIVNI